MNWGWKIVFAYVGFIALILTMVFKTMGMRIDLVRPDYYAEELRYQEKIDQSKNNALLSAPLSVTCNGQHIVLAFPEEMKNTPLEGSVLFYRPSDSRLDFRVNLEPGADGSQRINPPAQKGLYVVQVEWKAKGQTFYSESTLMIP
ncbi:MAG: FixH family protein [Bacteroidetes bacterium]|nr:MAG: FixH family protein [Bacteroidota bacterium]